MRFILDTCVISEIVRSRQHAYVAAWVDRSWNDCLLAAPVLMEIEGGVLLIRDMDRRAALRANIDRILRRFATGQRIVFDHAAAMEAGKVIGEGRQAGRPIGVTDAQIAGLARALGCQVVTRDVDFADRGVVVVNPWESAPRKSRP